MSLPINIKDLVHPFADTNQVNSGVTPFSINSLDDVLSVVNDDANGVKRKIAAIGFEKMEYSATPTHPKQRYKATALGENLLKIIE
ncbi:MAG TPA: hypothetical protein VKY36_06150 [Moheibacter sp.]|nr:hypothetical protein [Moheibacter sp.]